MRAFAHVLADAAESMQSHAAGARHTKLGFTAPAAKPMAARVNAWLAHVDRDAEGLRSVAQRLLLEAGGVEQAQQHYDKAAAQQRQAGGPR